MGNKLGLPRLVTGGLDIYLNDVQDDFVVESQLGNGRFLKLLKCLHNEGLVVVKLYLKGPDEPESAFEQHHRQLQVIQESFSFLKYPNVFSFSRFEQTDRAAYLIRQYLAHNLTDRMATQPFLRHTEKLWIAYQLLSALSQAHSLQICHGDVKSENCLLTSWGWLYLCDFASFKPTLIADRSDFSFYFDSSGRGSCNLAPERFIPENAAPTNRLTPLTPQMDLFSAGCVVAELFLEDVPLFEYHQVNAYRAGTYDPSHLLSRIPFDNVRALVRRLISLEPSQRGAAADLLEAWADDGFPAFFPLLHSYIYTLSTHSADDTIANLSYDFDSILRDFTATSTTTEISNTQTSTSLTPPPTIVSSSSTTTTSFNIAPSPTPSPAPYPSPSLSPALPHAHAQVEGSPKPPPSYDLIHETEKVIQRLESGLLISVNSPASFSRPAATPSPQPDPTPSPSLSPSHASSVSSSLSPSPSRSAEPTVREEIREEIIEVDQDLSHIPTPRAPQCQDSGLILILNLVCSSLSAVKANARRRQGLQILQRLAALADDDCLLQRITPWIVRELRHPHSTVRTEALKTLTHILGLVGEVASSDADVFPEYLFPAVVGLAQDPDELVRCTFAASLPRLAQISKKWLEMGAHWREKDVMEASMRFPRQEPSASFDSEFLFIREPVLEATRLILTDDSSPNVKRSLLLNITPLCHFFGREETDHHIVPILITMLNQSDKQLRMAFFERMVELSSFIGPRSLEDYLYPCIQQALLDEEEAVAEKCLNAIVGLCRLQLFRRQIVIDICERIVPFFLHPSAWVRIPAIRILECFSQQLPATDLYAFIRPSVLPLLNFDIDWSNCSYEMIRDALMAPLPRAVYEAALRLAATSPPNEPAEQVYRRLIDSGMIPSTEHSKVLSIWAFLLQAAPKSAAVRKRDQVPGGWAIGSTPGEAPKTPSIRVTIPPLTPQSGIDTDYPTRPAHRRIVAPADAPIWEDFFSLPSSPSGDGILSDPTTSSAATAAMMSDDAAVPRPVTTPLRYLPPKAALPLPPLPDFVGPVQDPWTTTNRSKKNPPFEPLDCWRPVGLLIANLHEHRGAVNALAVSTYNHFFASGSNDGMVCIWDSNRLRSNVTNRSRLHYSSQGGRITSLAMIDNTVVSGSDNGSVHAFRIDHQVQTSSGSAAGPSGHSKGSSKTHQSEFVQVPIDKMERCGGSILGVTQYQTNSQTLAVYTTSLSRIHGWDFRSRREAYLMQNPKSAGIISAFSVDSSRNWMVVGTSRGFYTIWDMRFTIPVRTWRHPTREPIHKLIQCPEGVDDSSGILAATGSQGNQLWLWDIRTASCKKFYRTLSQRSEPLPSLKPLQETSSLSTSFRADESILQTSDTSPVSSGILSGSPSLSDAAQLPSHVSAIVATPHFILTAGTDRRVRFWDRSPQLNSKSYSFCGDTYKSYALLSQSSAINVTRFEHGTTVIEELPRVSKLQQPHLHQTEVENRLLSPVSTPHRDAILDMKVLQVPGSNILLTASRDGTVRCWK